MSYHVCVSKDSLDVIDFARKQADPFRTPTIPGVKLDRSKGVDGEKFLEILEPLPKKGGEFAFEQKTTGIYDVGSAAIIETQFTVSCPTTHKLFLRCTSSSFLRGSGGFGGSRPPKPNAVDIPSREPDRVVELTTNEGQARLYRLSGDYNPLHIDPEHAKRVGFKEPILHGLCTFGIASHALVSAWAPTPSTSLVSVRGRFTSPVYCGETLVTETWKVKELGGEVTVAYRVKVKERNVVVMGGGVAVFKNA
ncbi:hypothetical protein HDU93_007256 [Gonapodya sp. JEL0774]|nr:hypothetical protein HDU93_007256 [Gonapodya sp. JEL0774]